MRKSKILNDYDVVVKMQIVIEKRYFKPYQITAVIINCDIPRISTMKFCQRSYTIDGLINGKEYSAVVKRYENGKVYMHISGHRIKLKGYYQMVIGGVGVNKRQSDFL